MLTASEERTSKPAFTAYDDEVSADGIGQAGEVAPEKRGLVELFHGLEASSPPGVAAGSGRVRVLGATPTSPLAGVPNAIPCDGINAPVGGGDGVNDPGDGNELNADKGDTF